MAPIQYCIVYGLRGTKQKQKKGKLTMKNQVNNYVSEINENDGNRIFLNEVQEKLLIGSVGRVKKAAQAFHKDYPHLDAGDLEGYLYEELFKSCSNYEPERMDGEKFVNMVLRNKCRQYVKLARNQRLKDSQIYLTSDEKEARDYEDSCVFVSAEDLEETVIFENDIKGAVKQLFEMANEQEREIMLLLMEGYRVEEIKRRLGFKHRETVRRIIKRLGKKLGYNPLT